VASEPIVSNAVLKGGARSENPEPDLWPVQPGSHGMSRLSALARIPERCAHPRPRRHTSSLLPTDIGCGTLAPRSRRPGTATHATRDSNLGSGNHDHDMSRLSAFACPNDAPIHGLADKPSRLLPTDIGCGALAPRSQTRHTQHHNFGYAYTN
jgi:hypothetical protein